MHLPAQTAGEGGRLWGVPEEIGAKEEKEKKTQQSLQLKKKGLSFKRQVCLET